MDAGDDDVSGLSIDELDSECVDASTHRENKGLPSVDYEPKNSEDERVDAGDDDDLAGGWRLLSKGRDRSGRVRFQLALGSGTKREWTGPMLLVVDSDTMERNERESKYQHNRKEAIERERGNGE